MQKALKKCSAFCFLQRQKNWISVTHTAFSKAMNFLLLTLNNHWRNPLDFPLQPNYLLNKVFAMNSLKIGT